MRIRPPFVALLLGALTLLGCPSRESLGAGAIAILGSGVINNPSNKSLRFDILKFGLERFCFEMLRRGAPLKMSDDQPVLGRFFGESCQSQVIDEESRKSFVVQYQGKGYAWVAAPIVGGGRIGFKSVGLIEYAPDFLMHEGAMYVYFRPRRIDATNFQVTLVESQLQRWAMNATGFNADETGRRIVKAQLERGFTVIRYNSEGDTDFGMGYVAKGQRPFKPFQVQSDKIQLANDRTELHTGQQDFVGAFEIKDDGKALYLTLAVDGAPAIDAFVIQKGTGDLMIERLVKESGAAPLPNPPLLDESAVAGQLWQRYLPLPKGDYYLLLDQSAEVGRTVPPARVGDDRAAKVDYLVQLGDRP